MSSVSLFLGPLFHFHFERNIIRENKEKEISNYDYYCFPKSTWTYMHGIWELHVHVHAYSNHVKARVSDGYIYIMSRLQTRENENTAILCINCLAIQSAVGFTQFCTHTAHNLGSAPLNEAFSMIHPFLTHNFIITWVHRRDNTTNFIPTHLF